MACCHTAVFAQGLSHLRVDVGESCLLVKIDWPSLTMSLELEYMPPVAPASPSGAFQKLDMTSLGMMPLALALNA
jgi:hypothetical protein